MQRSNCIIAAISVWWRFGGKICILRPCKEYVFGHWVVRIGKKTIHYCPVKKPLPWYKQLLFKGKLEWN